jgi:uncharacterized protein (TIGR03437 family)
MKFLVVLFSTALFCSAADFATSQAARLVIGQTSFTSQASGASDVLLGGVGGVAYVNDMLFVADSNRVGATPINNRVLIYKGVSGQFPQPTDELTQGSRCPACVGQANAVLGQSSLTTTDLGLSSTSMRIPTAVASDGKHLAVADTDNNRVLIWNRIPTMTGTPADVVVGQTSFTSNGTSRPPTAKSLRGPQGVWLQDGKLFVADTQNHRVLIWNKIPTSNGVAADIELGQADFTSSVDPDINWSDVLNKSMVVATASSLLNPVSVTSDGDRLYVADLGHNRVLIWTAIPTANATPANVVIGQPDFTTSVANYSYDENYYDEDNAVYVWKSVLCAQTGTDKYSYPTFPPRCEKTLSFPRFALSDGQRLFIADSGNDRVLVYNTIPTTNTAAADMVLGQIEMRDDLVSDGANPTSVSSSDSIRTPTALAWDGTNLYVTDPFDRRVVVYTPGDSVLPYTGVRNSAAMFTYAVGSITLSGSVNASDQITVQVTYDMNNNGDTTSKETGDYYTDNWFYTYTVLSGDNVDKILAALAEQINAGTGDPHVIATVNTGLSQLMLTARSWGTEGNRVNIKVTTSSGAKITASASGASLAGGGDAAKIAPGTLITVLGDNLSDQTATAPSGANPLPTELGGVQLYIDGIRAPLLYVSPAQINAQMPWEVKEDLSSTITFGSSSAYVRTVRSDGSVTATTATGVPILAQNPGLYAASGTDPRPGVVLHGSSNATGAVSVDGSITAGDIATVTIEDRNYSYTLQADDTLETVRDKLIASINTDPKVQASKATLFTRIILQARIPGPEGNNIVYSTSTKGAYDGVSGFTGAAANVILTALSSSLCCANEAYSSVTDTNPALPGETIIVYATGLGVVRPDAAQDAAITGVPYSGPYDHQASSSVSSLAGGKTANVFYAGLVAGSVGLYEVHLQLNSSLTTNSMTQVTISQDAYTSNIVTFPVVNTTPSTY